jgi:hypothetical protein
VFSGNTLLSTDEKLKSLQRLGLHRWIRSTILYGTAVEPIFKRGIMSRNVLDADANHSHHGGDTSVVPLGLYCYRIAEVVAAENDMPRVKIQTCPYWGRRKIADTTYGYCAHLKIGDWQDGGTLFLHDMVKECGINIDEEAKAGHEETH